MRSQAMTPLRCLPLGIPSLLQVIDCRAVMGLSQNRGHLIWSQNSRMSATRTLQFRETPKSTSFISKSSKTRDFYIGNLPQIFQEPNHGGSRSQIRYLYCFRAPLPSYSGTWTSVASSDLQEHLEINNFLTSHTNPEGPSNQL